MSRILVWTKFWGVTGHQPPRRLPACRSRPSRHNDVAIVLWLQTSSFAVSQCSSGCRPDRWPWVSPISVRWVSRCWINGDRISGVVITSIYPTYMYLELKWPLVWLEKALFGEVSPKKMSELPTTLPTTNTLGLLSFVSTVLSLKLTANAPETMPYPNFRSRIVFRPHQFSWGCIS